jgi:hypothetical protein
VLDFFFFMLILLGFISGSAFIYVMVTRLSRRIEPGGEDLTVSMLRDELDSLSIRVGRVEEEMDFYKRLKGPGGPELPAPLQPTDDQDS